MRFNTILSGLLLAGLASQAPAQTTLKDAYQGMFKIGAAINPGHFTERDAAGAALVKKQFNTISPENDLKWERIHPTADTFNWGPADQYVAFGEANKMFIVGHCLVWHSQVPRWVFEGVDREGLLKRMREHITAVVTRYKGRINGWDVVNEALNEDGTLRQSQWYKIIGEDFIAKAFEYAHAADPSAELYYNDYNLETPAKRDGAVALVKKLKAQGLTVTAIGTQSHDKIDGPSAEAHEAAIKAFAAAGVKVAVTEFDIDVLPRGNRQATADVSQTAAAGAAANPYVQGLPDEVQQALAKRYADLFAVFVRNKEVMSRVTFWGVTDANTWLHNFPVRGRTNYPLLFDKEGKEKPAFDAVIKAAKGR
jgi:endo-1,4-beta-xylanase